MSALISVQNYELSLHLLNFWWKTPKASAARVRSVSNLHRKNAGKGIGPDSQNKKPGTDGQQNVATPALHLLCARFQIIHQPLLRCGDGRRQQEEEQDERQRSHHKGDKSRRRAANSQSLPGQTGQDRACSTEACQHIDETEKTKSQSRSLAAHLRLPPHQGAG